MSPKDHLLRSIDRFVDLTGVRQRLTPFYSTTGRSSVDPELVIRMPLGAEGRADHLGKRCRNTGHGRCRVEERPNQVEIIF
jgi:hypothetical protein